MPSNLLAEVFVDSRPARNQLNPGFRNDIRRSDNFMAFRHGGDRIDVIGCIVNERLRDRLIRWVVVVLQGQAFDSRNKWRPESTSMAEEMCGLIEFLQLVWHKDRCISLIKPERITPP